MKPFKTFAVIVTLALAACAGMTSFDQRLRGLEGHPVNDADLMLGHHATGDYKDSSGNTVYVWQKTNYESVFGPTVTHGGYPILGSDNLVWTGIKVDNCTIRATTADGIIRHVTMEGNPGGCEIIYGGRRKELGYDVSQRP